MLQEKSTSSKVKKTWKEKSLQVFFTLIEILSILLQNFCYYLFEHLD